MMNNLEILLKSFYQYIEHPKTDIIDFALLLAGETEYACLYVKPKALENGNMETLATLAEHCGIYASDLNGNPYLSNDKRVPVWVVCKYKEQLQTVLGKHGELQPKGFKYWATYLGELLNYPDCCIRSYTEAVKTPHDRENFWEITKSEVEAQGEIILGFSPCSFECEKAYLQIKKRLKMAYFLGLIKKERIERWLILKNKKEDLHWICNSNYNEFISPFLFQQ